MAVGPRRRYPPAMQMWAYRLLAAGVAAVGTAVGGWVDHLAIVVPLGLAAGGVIMMVGLHRTRRRA